MCFFLHKQSVMSMIKYRKNQNFPADLDNHLMKFYDLLLQNYYENVLGLYSQLVFVDFFS